MTNKTHIFDAGELHTFKVWQKAQSGTIFLDVLNTTSDGQMTLRYTLTTEQAVELLRQTGAVLHDQGISKIRLGEPEALQ